VVCRAIEPVEFVYIRSIRVRVIGILVLHCLVRRRVRPTLSRFFAEDSCSVAIGGACIFDQSCRASYRPCLFGCSELAFFVARLRLLCR
jgi:hypothetical protein